MNAAEFKAREMISTFQNALAKGYRHFDPETGEELYTVSEILTALVKHSKITIIEPGHAIPVEEEWRHA